MQFDTEFTEKAGEEVEQNKTLENFKNAMGHNLVILKRGLCHQVWTKD